MVQLDPLIRPFSGASTLSQSGPESNGNKVVLCNLQSSSITGASPLCCLVSYPGVLLFCGDAVGVFYSYEIID